MINKQLAMDIMIMAIKKEIAKYGFVPAKETVEFGKSIGLTAEETYSCMAKSNA